MLIKYCAKEFKERHFTGQACKYHISFLVIDGSVQGLETMYCPLQYNAIDWSMAIVT